MTNLLWYVCLAVISVGITAYTIYVKRNIFKVSTLIVLYFFTAAMAWIGEFIVLGILNAYAYKTGLFADPWAQNLLGHLLLNTTIYPVTAVVMVAYSFRYGWITLVTVIFVLIEYLFMKMGIYEQHWWRYYMSAISVAVYLLISRKWFAGMNQKRYGLTRAVTFYFAAIIFIHMPSPLLLLSGKQHYHLGLLDTMFGDLYLSSIVFSFINHLIESFLLVLCVCILKKWYWKLLPFIISPVVEIIYFKMNILIMDDSWNLGYTLVISEICIALFVLFEKYTLRPDLYRLERNG